MPLVLLIAALALFAGVGVVSAKAFLTQPQAIHLAFPLESVQRKTAFVTSEQAARVEALSGVKLESRLLTYYVGRSSAGVEGVAFFDRRTVRTLPVVYMAVVKPSGSIDRVEVLSFDEPDDYLPPPRWLTLWRGRFLNEDFSIGRGIPRITGASLTSQAMNDGLRTILAAFEIVVKPTL